MGACSRLYSSFHVYAAQAVQPIIVYLIIGCVRTGIADAAGTGELAHGCARTTGNHEAALRYDIVQIK